MQTMNYKNVFGSKEEEISYISKAYGKINKMLYGTYLLTSLILADPGRIMHENIESKIVGAKEIVQQNQNVNSRILILLGMTYVFSFAEYLTDRKRKKVVSEIEDSYRP